MSQASLFACLALAAALVLCFRSRPLLFPIIALVVSLLEVALAFGVAHLSVAHLPLGLILGAALLVSGIGVLVRAGEKYAVSAATVAALIGALQTLAALHLH